VKDCGVCFVFVERLMKILVSLALRERDIKAFVFQNSWFFVFKVFLYL